MPRTSEQFDHKLLDSLSENPKRFKDLKQELNPPNENYLYRRIRSLKEDKKITKRLIDDKPHWFLTPEMLEDHLPDDYSKDIEKVIEFLNDKGWLKRKKNNHKVIDLDNEKLDELIEFIKGNCEVIGTNVELDSNQDANNFTKRMMLVDQILNRVDNEVKTGNDFRVEYEGNALSLLSIGDIDEIRKTVEIQEKIKQSKEDGRYTLCYPLEVDEEKECSKCGTNISSDEQAYYDPDRDISNGGIRCEDCAKKVDMVEGI